MIFLYPECTQKYRRYPATNTNPLHTKDHLNYCGIVSRSVSLGRFNEILDYHAGRYLVRHKSGLGKWSLFLWGNQFSVFFKSSVRQLSNQNFKFTDDINKLRFGSGGYLDGVVMDVVKRNLSGNLFARNELGNTVVSLKGGNQFHLASVTNEGIVVITARCDKFWLTEIISGRCNSPIISIA